MAVKLDRFLKTEKQKAFGYDFFLDAESYEVWDEVKIGAEYWSEQTFEVTREDMLAYAQGVMDPNPLFNDEEHARQSMYGELVPHPLFCVVIAFWCISTKGRGSWIRSPGAINPGQRIEVYDHFRIGDVIRVKQTAWDRWTRRDWHYLTYKLDYYDQNDVLKAIWYCTLILPESRARLMEYVKMGREG